jgi:hypothetical protein
MNAENRIQVCFGGFLEKMLSTRGKVLILHRWYLSLKILGAFIGNSCILRAGQFKPTTSEKDLSHLQQQKGVDRCGLKLAHAESTI